MKALNKPVELPDGDVVVTWFELQATARFWHETYVPMIEGDPAQRKIMRDALVQQHETASRLRAFPAERWAMFCDGIGWTPVAAAAWSWCEDARLEAVLDIGRRLGWQPARRLGEDFAALLIDPAQLPPNRLSDIVRAGHDAFGAALILAARLEPPEIDLPDRNLAAVPPSLREMLTVRGWQGRATA